MLINLNLIRVIITQIQKVPHESTAHVYSEPTSTWFYTVHTYRVRRILIDCYQNSKQRIVPSPHSKANTKPQPKYSKYSAVFQYNMHTKQSSFYYLIQIPSSASPTGCHKVDGTLIKFRVVKYFTFFLINLTPLTNPSEPHYMFYSLRFLRASNSELFIDRLC